MKKFLTILAVAFGFLTVSNAQTVQPSRFTDNMYFGTNVGASTDLRGFGDFIYPSANVYVGKWVTRQFGVELNGGVGFHDKFKTNLNSVRKTYVGGNVMWNLNESFGRFNGNSDVVEVIPFYGFGWDHRYGNSRNFLTNRFGANVMFRLTKKNDWHLNVRPFLEYVIAGTGMKTQYNINRGQLYLEAGFTYRFKNKNGLHNFALCPNKYTQEYVDELNRVTNELANQVEELKTRRVVPDTVYRDEPVDNQYKISFKQGSYNLTSDLAYLADAVKKSGKKVVIVGYASPEGSEKRNSYLSKQRAYIVKQELIKLGVPSDKIKVSTSYNDRRAAIVTLED